MSLPEFRRSFPRLFCFSCWAICSIQPWVSPIFPASHIVHQAGLTHECIQARLLTWPETNGSRISFIAAVESLGEEGKAVTGRVRVSAGKDDVPPLRRGDAVRFSGRIREIRSFRNPGGFDYERFMAFQEIHCATYVRKGQPCGPDARGMGKAPHAAEGIPAGRYLRVRRDRRSGPGFMPG